MNKKKYFIPLILLLCMMSFSALAQDSVSLRINPAPMQEIRIPDILGYQTLVCDFHTHTVFSDGMVWPTIRAQEAWREGLDAIAITDHIEYQPHKEDIPTNHNRPYILTHEFASQLNLLMPRGTEITRDTPPGHYNAIFVDDIDPLETDKFLDVIKEANEQGGFVFWNHPGWKGVERGRWREFHDTMKENKWLHGIEVCNGGTYYKEAHEYAIKYNLTMMGTSDIHQPALGLPRRPDRHRTTSLVFVKERTLESIKEALFARRTAVWYKNMVIGDEAYLSEIFNESLKISSPHHSTGNTRYFLIENCSEVTLKLKKNGKFGPDEIEIPAKSTIQVSMRISGEADEVRLPYKVTNFLIGPGKPLPVELVISVK